MSEQIHPLWNQFIRAVQEEVKPALGCTEPVSLALACATAADLLPGEVTRIEAWVSPNLMKNGLGVTVPGTGMVGLPIAAALGAIGGNAHAGLEVLKDATADALVRAKALLEAGQVQVKLQEPCDEILYSRACVYAGELSAMVTIAGGHTRVVEVVCQGETRFTLDKPVTEVDDNPLAVLSHATLSQILEFVEQVPYEAIRFILEAGQLNDALSREGLSGKWGLHIGATLEKQRSRGWLAQDLGSDIIIRTSAASDARMGGATLPAMSNSGSGNQGITVTMPVLVYAREWKISEEKMYRAMLVSNLVSIYIKHYIGALSAFCGAVSAACGSGAAITFMAGGDYQHIGRTITNTLANVGGIVCDGAKRSCAAKIAASVHAALLAHYMSMSDKQFQAGEGIVEQDVEETIKNMGYIGRVGMKSTDKEILNVMIDKADVDANL